MKIGSITTFDFDEKDIIAFEHVIGVLRGITEAMALNDKVNFDNEEFTFDELESTLFTIEAMYNNGANNPVDVH